MADDRQSVFNYLHVTESLSSIDRKRLEGLRTFYTTLSKSDSNEYLLMNDEENLEYLKLCVTSNSLEVACQAIFGKYLDQMIAQKRQVRNVIPVMTTTVANQAISKAICQILIKRNESIVIEFLEKFLLTPLDAKATNTHNDFRHNLLRGCALDLFIRGEFIDVGRSNHSRRRIRYMAFRSSSWSIRIQSSSSG